MEHCSIFVRHQVNFNRVSIVYRKKNRLVLVDNEIGFRSTTITQTSVDQNASIVNKKSLSSIPQVEADSSTPIVIIKPEDQPSPPLQ